MMVEEILHVSSSIFMVNKMLYRDMELDIAFFLSVKGIFDTMGSGMDLGGAMDVDASVLYYI